MIDFIKKDFKKNPPLFLAESVGTIIAVFSTAYISFYPTEYLLYPFIGWLFSDILLICCSKIRGSTGMMFLMICYTVLTIIGIYNILQHVPRGC